MPLKLCLTLKSEQQTRHVVLWIMLAGHLSKKKELILGSKEIDTINNSDIYDTKKDLYLSKKEYKEKLLQGIQSANG